VVEAAAEQLATDLRDRQVQGIVAVGVRQTTPEIIVYVLRITPALKQAIPTSWQDVPVTIKRHGAIRPA
jgi:hypothetical protein